MPDNGSNSKPKDRATSPASGSHDAIRLSMRRTAELQRSTAQAIREQARRGVLGFRVKVF